MTLRNGFPSASGVVGPQDLRLDLAGLILRDTSGNPRLGVFPRHVNAIVSSRADMKVDVSAFEAAVGRSGQGAILLANDGTVQVTIPAAPVANSRYDIVWVKQNDSVSPNADSDDLPVLGVTSGTAAPVPDKAAALAAVPAGALALASVLVPSGKTATNQSGVVITQEFPYTTVTGGILWFRTTAARDAVTSLPEGTMCQVAHQYYTFEGSTWGPLSSGILPMIELSESAAFSATTSLSTINTWGTEVRKSGFSSPASGVLTVPKDGWYSLSLRVAISIGSITSGQLAFLAGGNTYGAIKAASSNTSFALATHAEVYLTAGQTIAAQVARDPAGTVTDRRLTVLWLRP